MGTNILKKETREIPNNILNKGMRLEGENRRFFSSKGYIYTLEALVVVTLVLVTIAFMFNAPSQNPELEISNIKQQGFEALEYMDAKGELARIVWENDETELESQLGTLLSKNLAFQTNICSLNCSALSVTANETVIGVSYYVAGYRNIYLGRKAVLWMWRKI